MAADPGGGAWQDFGQRVDLTARIREILRDYSEGTGVFKELLQVVCSSSLQLSWAHHIQIMHLCPYRMQMMPRPRVSGSASTTGSTLQVKITPGMCTCSLVHSFGRR
jgi:hypothetical protein